MVFETFDALTFDGLIGSTGKSPNAIVGLGLFICGLYNVDVDDAVDALDAGGGKCTTFASAVLLLPRAESTIS